MSTSWWSTACQVSSTICESRRFSLQCAFIGRPDGLAGLPDPAAFYTPDEEQYEPESLFRRDRKPPARKATPTVAGVKPKRPMPHHPPWRSKGFQSFCQRFLHSWSTSHSALVCVSACGWEASRTGSSGIRKAGPCSRIIPDRRLLLGTCMSWSNQEH